MAGRREIIIPYAPRPQFMPFHDRKERWACIVAHRRAGKTVATINDMIKKAVTDGKPNGRYAYIAPFLKQAKSVAWDYLKRYSAPIIKAVSETELKVTLINGSEIRLFGADNIDALRGIYLDGVILDEYADMYPTLWSMIIRPALSDRLGWAVFIGTPKGKNEFFNIYDAAKNSPDWFCSILKASETDIIQIEELLDARKQMTEEQYDQEFECSFTAAITGSYYGKLISQAEAEGRICDVVQDGKSIVYTAWDLGIGDSTAIVFWQYAGDYINVIDYYEASGQGLDHYVKVLREKPYVYTDRNIFPHDIKVRELSTGRTRLETLEGLGVRGEVLDKASLEDGINEVRLVFPRCRFDKNRCRPLIEALAHYQKEYDEKLKIFKSHPRHDWSSHGADAFRYFALGQRKEDPAKAWLEIDTRYIV